MPRIAFLRTCALMLLGFILTDIATAQLPVKPILPTQQPEMFRGTLLLCGGGVIPQPIRDEFYKLGKGTEGTLVLIPTASPRSDAGDFSMWIDYWSGFRWKSVDVIHIADRQGAFDSSLVETMRKASAVWISGGEQQRLSDRFVETPIEKEMHALLGRGGIVGGTSAGAAIASSNMIASGAIEPQFAAGFHFLPSLIIDQHFTQKNRHGRLLKAIEAHPHQTGMGIDESTGVFVNKDEARVVGDGGVFLLKKEAIQKGPRVNDIQSNGYQRLQAGDILKTSELTH